MDRLMVAATIPTKFVILFSSLFLFSCQNKIIVAENNLIDGMEISRYVRVTEFSGTITTTYNDCLLYTSPSPRDLSTSRMPSSA